MRKGITPATVLASDLAIAEGIAEKRAARGSKRNAIGREACGEMVVLHFIGSPLQLEDSFDRLGGDPGIDGRLPDGRTYDVRTVKRTGPPAGPAAGLDVFEDALEAGLADLFIFVEELPSGQFDVLGYVHRDDVPDLVGPPRDIPGHPGRAGRRITRAMLHPAAHLAAGKYRGGE